jgi:outer membrane protein OmpA-like peptidoglycan-associated protein
MMKLAVGLVVLPLLLSCHLGPKVRAMADGVRTDVDRARRSNGARCAPRELATAEAHLQFTYGELDQGNSSRAAEHLAAADSAARKAVSLSRDCAPRQVVVKESKPIVVKIEESDKDGDQLSDKDDACPSLPGPLENKGCPVEVVKDSDGDGISDAHDGCPDVAEDKDGFEDTDGCPESDNDKDGTVDGMDACPNEPGPASNLACPVGDTDGDGIKDDADNCQKEPEDKDGFQDEDGCPDLDNDGDGVPDDRDECPDVSGPPENKGCARTYSLVAVTKERIEIKKQLKFATNSSTIVGDVSEKILREVAQALADNVQIRKLRVEGHTDSNGDDARNLVLSEGRANAVKSGLIRLGVDPSRLDAVGFGEAKPVAPNTTAAGRAANRRTEFNIVDQ